MALVETIPEINGGYVLLMADGSLVLAMGPTRGWIITPVGQYFTMQFNHDQLGVNKANLPQYDVIAVFNCTTTPLNQILDLKSYATRIPIWVKQN